jgi:hypothetical protein
VHLVCDADPGVHGVSASLRDRFGIGHSTIQVETETDALLCRLRPAEVI